MIRSYYRCCCINEPVMFISRCVHVELRHRFHALLKVCSDRDDVVPLMLPYVEQLSLVKYSTAPGGSLITWTQTGIRKFVIKNPRYSPKELPHFNLWQSLTAYSKFANLSTHELTYIKMYLTFAWRMDQGGAIIIELAKQRILLSNVKQTTSHNAYILYDGLAGNQRNLLSKTLW